MESMTDGGHHVPTAVVAAGPAELVERHVRWMQEHGHRLPTYSGAARPAHRGGHTVRRAMGVGSKLKERLRSVGSRTQLLPRRGRGAIWRKGAGASPGTNVLRYIQMRKQDRERSKIRKPTTCSVHQALVGHPGRVNHANRARFRTQPDMILYDLGRRGIFYDIASSAASKRDSISFNLHSTHTTKSGIFIPASSRGNRMS